MRVPRFTPYIGTKFAEHLGKTDPIASVFAYEALLLENPDLHPPGYLQALVRTQRWVEADAYWSQLPTQAQRTEDALRAKAEVAQALGDDETAARAWNQIWLDTGKAGARARGMALLAKNRSPEALITALEETRSLYGPLTLEEVILLADAHRRAHHAADCAGTIASRDFARAPVKVRRRAFSLQTRCHRADPPATEAFPATEASPAPAAPVTSPGR